ncbi:MAG: argininosuccinate synthase, partial [Thermomicrobia bacterium]|nr:argininosuccinate synthase [Thermomicrobia bacterium]
IEDLRSELVTNYIWPTLKSGAIYERKYLLGTSFARYPVAKRQAEIAKMEGADAVAHGCTGKGNDQVRFELTFKSVDPNLRVIVPWREWELKSRKDEIDYCLERRIPVTATLEKIYSHDRNLWHLSSEGGALEDPWNEPPEDMFEITKSPEDAPDKPTYIEIGFEQGLPVSLDGAAMDPVDLVYKLNEIGGENGIGREDLVENRLVGMKSHGVYETPGGSILVTAQKELESIVLDRDTMHYKDVVAARFAELVYNGQWFTPLREAMSAFFDVTQRNMTGTVRLKLYKGNIIIAGRKSPYSLYREDFATFEEDEVYNQADSRGFINLFGLPITVQALLKQERALGTNDK